MRFLITILLLMACVNLFGQTINYSSYNSYNLSGGQLVNGRWWFWGDKFHYRASGTTYDVASESWATSRFWNLTGTSTLTGDADVVGTSRYVKFNLGFSTDLTYAYLDASGINMGIGNGDFDHIGSLVLQKGSAKLEAGSIGGGYLAFDIQSGTPAIAITATSLPTFQGIKYPFDISANYTSRSLVDKAYVDGLVTGGVPTSRTISTTSPLTGGGDLSANRTFAINDAAADGSTKGAASFTANDFNSSSGNISLDYSNGQAASGSVNGFLSSSDWTTFNGKVGGSGSSGRVAFWTGAGTQSSSANFLYNSGNDEFIAGGVELDNATVQAPTLSLESTSTSTVISNDKHYFSNGAQFGPGSIPAGPTNTLIATFDPSTLDVEYIERDIRRIETTIAGTTYLDIDVTPQVVIPAPGAGKYINIISAVVERHLDALAYTITCTGDLGLKYDTGTSAQALYRVYNENIEQTTSTNRYYKFFEAAYDGYIPQGEILEDEPIVVTILDGGSISASSSIGPAITIKVVYTIEDTF